MGPVEVLIIGFEGSRFTGKVTEALVDAMEKGIIAVVDGVVATRALDGSVTYHELSPDSELPGVAELAALVGERHELVGAADIDDLVLSIEPGSAAAVVVFEHRWALPLRDAILATGGTVVADYRLEGAAVQAVLDAENAD